MEQTLWFFRFCQSIQSLLLLLSQQGQQEVLISMFLIVAAPMEDEIPKAGYLKLYAAYGMLGIMLGWIQNKFRETPEELAKICTE